MFLNNSDKQISFTNGTNTIGDWLEVSHNKDPPQDNENVLGSPGPIFSFSIPGAQLIANSKRFFFPKYQLPQPQIFLIILYSVTTLSIFMLQPVRSHEEVQMGFAGLWTHFLGIQKYLQALRTYRMQCRISTCQLMALQ